MQSISFKELGLW